MKINFFFDAGAGVCLWAADDEAKRIYNYPIDLEVLPISQVLIKKGEALVDIYDLSINWDNPSSGSLWTSDQKDCFLRDSQTFYSELVKELGTGYEVVNLVCL